MSKAFSAQSSEAHLWWRVAEQRRITILCRINTCMRPLCNISMWHDAYYYKSDRPKTTVLSRVIIMSSCLLGMYKVITAVSACTRGTKAIRTKAVRMCLLVGNHALWAFLTRQLGIAFVRCHATYTEAPWLLNTRRVKKTITKITFAFFLIKSDLTTYKKKTNTKVEKQLKVETNHCASKTFHIQTKLSVRRYLVNMNTV